MGGESCAGSVGTRQRQNNIAPLSAQGQDSDADEVKALTTQSVRATLRNMHFAIMLRTTFSDGIFIWPNPNKVDDEKRR